MNLILLILLGWLTFDVAVVALVVLCARHNTRRSEVRMAQMVEQGRASESLIGLP